MRLLNNLSPLRPSVIPAKAGIQKVSRFWIPAFAGMTILPTILIGCSTEPCVGGGITKSRKTYCIKGRKYTPQQNYNYCACGIASWYGPGFHGKKNACGYRFNQHTLVAAHKTLPLPSIVRVTNLENGKSVVVICDDRGPFSKERIIDLSHAAAKKIGMIGKGTAFVRVECLAKESKCFAEYLKCKGYKKNCNYQQIYERCYK